MAFFSVAPASLSVGDAAPTDPPPPNRVLLVGAVCKLIVATGESRLEISLFHLCPQCSHYSGVSISKLAVSENPSAVICGAVSPSNVHVAACSDNKTLAVWRRRREGGGADWTRLGAR